MLIYADAVATGTLAVGAMGVFVGAATWLATRQRKQIAYRLVSAQIVDVRPEARDRISILFDDHQVGDVRSINVRVVSTGNVPITPPDFLRPISVDFGTSAQILTWNLADVSSPDLQPAIVARDSTLTVEPLLLNPGDYFELTAIVGDMSPGPRLAGRIAGVSKFALIADRSISRRLISIAATVTAIVAGATGALVVDLTKAPLPKPYTLVTFQSGRRECGVVVNLDPEHIGIVPMRRVPPIAMQLAGALPSIPRSELLKIEPHAC